MPLEGDARPLSKDSQLARGERRYRRQVASPKRWAKILDAKQGPCRVCGKLAPNELHHVVSRSLSGSDTEANLVPLCRECHALVEARHPEACLTLASGLSDDEYSYAVERGGEGFLEHRYGITYRHL